MEQNLLGYRAAFVRDVSRGRTGTFNAEIMEHLAQWLNLDLRLEEARRRLLEEGARSYVAANTALLDFRRQVSGRCREVLERRIEEYSAALGVELSPASIVKWAGPPDPAWTGVEAGLGVKIGRFQADAELYGALYCGLYWAGQGGKSPWFGVHHGIGLNRRSYAEAAFAALEKIGVPGVAQQGNDVALSELLTPEGAGGFQEQLEKSLGTWIDGWKRIWGLKALQV